jgi:hypothetical protein
VLAAQEDALEIGIDLRVPTSSGQFHRTAGCRATHIVDKHIDAAKALHAGLHHPSDGGAVGNVGLVGLDCSAGRAHSLDRLAHALQVAVDRENLGPFLGEAYRHRPSVAPSGANAAGAGDEGDFACQPAGHGDTPPP